MSYTLCTFNDLNDKTTYELNDSKKRNKDYSWLLEIVEPIKIVYLLLIQTLCIVYTFSAELTLQRNGLSGISLLKLMLEYISSVLLEHPFYVPSSHCLTQAVTISSKELG